jgi:hypothetical protein
MPVEMLLIDIFNIRGTVCIHLHTVQYDDSLLVCEEIGLSWSIGHREETNYPEQRRNDSFDWSGR